MEFYEGTRIVMPDEKIRALVMNRPHPELDGLLKAKGWKVDRIDDAKDGEELGRYLESGGYNVLFKRNGGEITSQTLRTAGQLFYVGLCCVGDGSVKDKPDALNQGVVFQNSPDGNAKSVVELFVGTLLDLARRIGEKDRGIREGGFPKDEKGREIAGSRLGIVGGGNIGSKVAVVAKQLGMKVAIFDEDPRFGTGDMPLPDGVEKVDSLEELFETCDVVTLHPSNFNHKGRSNNGLVTEDLLKRLGSRAELDGKEPLKLILNLARAPLATPEVLKKAFREGWIEGAALDVFPDEPETAAGRKNWTARPFTDEELRTGNWVNTPHVGASTPEAQLRVAKEASVRAATHIATGALGLLYGNGMLRRSNGGLEIDAFRHGAEPRVLAIHSTEPRTVANVGGVLANHFGSVSTTKTEDLMDGGKPVVGVSIWAFPDLDAAQVSPEVMQDVVKEVKRQAGSNPLRTLRLMNAPGDGVSLKNGLSKV